MELKGTYVEENGQEPNENKRKFNCDLIAKEARRIQDGLEKSIQSFERIEQPDESDIANNNLDKALRDFFADASKRAKKLMGVDEVV